MNEKKAYLVKLLLTLCVLGAAVWMNPTKSLAEADVPEILSVSEKGIEYVKSTDSTVTIRWKPVRGADGYRICYQGISANKLRTIETAKTQITLKGLNQEVLCRGQIEAFKNTKDGRICSGGTFFNNFPVKKPKISSFKAGLFDFEEGPILEIAVKSKYLSDECQYGYQYQVYNCKNKMLLSGNFSGSLESINSKKLTANQFYKVRVRPYVKITNGSGKSKNVFGSWSGSKQTAKVVSGAVVKAKSIKQHTISWKKVAGATGYEVYTASKADGSYKKIATTKKTSYTLQKFITKEVYIRIVPIRKGKRATDKAAIPTGTSYAVSIFPAKAFWFYSLYYASLDSDTAHRYYMKNADSGEEFFY